MRSFSLCSFSHLAFALFLLLTTGCQQPADPAQKDEQAKDATTDSGTVKDGEKNEAALPPLPVQEGPKIHEKFADVKNETGKMLKIAVIPKGTTHEFWKSVHYGAEEAAKQVGNVEIFWKGPLMENDRDGQITVVEDFITKQVDGICLAPLDSSSLVEPVKLAVEKEIPVVIFDSGLDGDEENYVSYVATDNYKGGAIAAKQMGRVLRGKGNVIMLRYTQGSESTTQREKGFLETLETEFPEINILSSDEYAGTTPESSFDKARQVLQKYQEDVDGIFAVCEPNATGTLNALKELDLQKKTKFIAFDPNAELVAGLEEGTVHGIVLQDPVVMGYAAVMAMVKKMNGGEVEKRIPTGEYLAAPENRETEQMIQLLEPEQFQD